MPPQSLYLPTQLLPTAKEAAVQPNLRLIGKRGCSAGSSQVVRLIFLLLLVGPDTAVPDIDPPGWYPSRYSPFPMTDSRYWGAPIPMTDSALRNEYREGRYRETIIGGGSIGKPSPEDGFPILTPPNVSLTHIGAD
jgi:hypothetical protein